MNRILCFPGLAITLLTIFLQGCNGGDRFGAKTSVSIKGDKWLINNTVINKNSPAEGLLMNVRMVNSVFEDRGDKIPSEYAGFDPESNADEFISMIPEYVSYGVNAFTISLQGGMPGYEGAINTAFEPDGRLRETYMSRVARVIKAADQNSAIIILSCFYQRQHSHSSALEGKAAILNALSSTVKWIKENNFRNVILEVSNEYRHGGYRNWKDGKWLLSTKGQIEMMTLVKNIYPALIVSTSGMGDGQLYDSLANVTDYITLHFNNTSLEDYAKRISGMKKSGKPVLCNEDDKIGQAGAAALLFSVMNGCGWGFMHSRQNQNMPFKFDGFKDDSVTYSRMRNLTTPGYVIDNSSVMLSSVIITYPNDGDIFKKDQALNMRFSFLSPDTANKSIIRIFANNKEAGIAGPGQKQYRLVLKETGIVYLNIVVTDEKGIEILRSPKVDVIVKEN